MNIIYNEEDITASVQPLVLRLTDNAGGKPDSITAVFADSEGLWSKWKPAKGDRIQVREGGFNSGVMFIDQLAQKAGKFEIKALSIPQASKTARSQVWENVRLLEIAAQIAARYGFILRVFNVENHIYERVDQIEDPDFAFLAFRCMLEGYALKISDRSIIIYDERMEEQKPAGSESTIYLTDMIEGFEFTDTSIDIFKKSIVRNQIPTRLIQGEYSDDSVDGPTSTKNLYTTNQAEANRWAKGVLRGWNKQMVSGTFSTNLRPGLAAGSNVYVLDIGMFDGKYFIDRLIHDFVKNRTRMMVRKPLEGY
jgi:uncharacterized protein